MERAKAKNAKDSFSPILAAPVAPMMGEEGLTLDLSGGATANGRCNMGNNGTEDRDKPIADLLRLAWGEHPGERRPCKHCGELPCLPGDVRVTKGLCNVCWSRDGVRATYPPVESRGARPRIRTLQGATT